MNQIQLPKITATIDLLLAGSSAHAAVLWSDADSGQVLYSYSPELPLVSASTIKTPLMLALLEKVRQKKLTLMQPVTVPRMAILPDTMVFELGQEQYPLWELIYWMIVESDNTATNVLMDLIGMEEVNRYCATTLGCQHTTLQRKMLDFDAITQGRNNYTSARDMEQIYRHIYRRDILTPELCDWAMGVLLRQRSTSQFLRYIADDIRLAHKTGGLDHLNHDCGLFLLPNAHYYLGVFLWDTADIGGDKVLVGRIAKAIYDTYKEVAQ